eukprot:149796-Pyramimonas_sp.AAC.1
MLSDKFYYEALDTIQKVRAMMQWAPLSLSDEMTGAPSTCTPCSMPSGTAISTASTWASPSGATGATGTHTSHVLPEASSSTRSVTQAAGGFQASERKSWAAQSSA